eukprot:CAMPEP_0202041206 /NCGR_PEP_ID=MMETSP0962-20130828/23357_1 /ASSEMBLY_ACC=CAM_ASM_000488 /TAXON_ID=4773 /ORGANISM="Schizochytrium aggregatum, Strain ATCC28209" /LENGTH=67 /DNA_ID=CAMNT_0048605525 /DNA_START=63 /DNA_END=266 /DNA_ORIENTATION=+
MSVTTVLALVLTALLVLVAIPKLYYMYREQVYQREAAFARRMDARGAEARRQRQRADFERAYGYEPR